jgi:pimeloyl-ACP methyl ester carboxylesterase
MKDFAFGPPVLAEWKRRFPQALVVELPDAGHFLQEDGYERIVPEIRALLVRQAKTP